MNVKLDVVDNMLAIYLEHDGSRSSTDIDPILTEDRFDIDDMSYGIIWNKVVQKILGHFLFSGKRVGIGDHVLFYHRKHDNGLHAAMQLDHAKSIVREGSMEMGRLTKLLQQKYGKQLEIMMEHCN